MDLSHITLQWPYSIDGCRADCADTGKTGCVNLGNLMEPFQIILSSKKEAYSLQVPMYFIISLTLFIHSNVGVKSCPGGVSSLSPNTPSCGERRFRGGSA